MSQKGWVYTALFIANLIYAGNYTFAKLVMPEYIQPFGFILIRVTVACVLFWLVSIKFPEKVLKKDFPRLALCAVFGVALNQLCFFYGLALTVPINASIIMVTTPILVLIISLIAKEENLTRRKSIGIALGLAGAMILILKGSKLNIGSNTIFGDIFIWINAASYGIYLVLAKPLMKKYQAITIIKWIFLFGSLYVIPFGWKDFTIIDWQVIPTSIWWSIAYVVIGTTFIAYLLNTISLKYVNASVVGAFIYAQPILAAVIAVSLGEDKITLLKIISTVIIFIGVYLVSTKKNQKAAIVDS